MERRQGSPGAAPARASCMAAAAVPSATWGPRRLCRRKAGTATWQRPQLCHQSPRVDGASSLKDSRMTCPHGPSRREVPGPGSRGLPLSLTCSDLGGSFPAGCARGALRRRGGWGGPGTWGRPSACRNGAELGTQWAELADRPSARRAEVRAWSPQHACPRARPSPPGTPGEGGPQDRLA